jgi:hypothetical protein
MWAGEHPLTPRAPPQVLDVETMPLLFSLVFGEGIINDATSVVLLGAISRVFPPSGESGRWPWRLVDVRGVCAHAH